MKQEKLKTVFVLGGRAIPKAIPDENVSQVFFNAIQKEINLDVPPLMMKNVHRLKTKNNTTDTTNSVICVTMENSDLKAKLFKAFVKNKPKGLYINEFTSPYYRHLLLRALNIKKEHPSLINNCYFKFGALYVRNHKLVIMYE